MIILRLSQEKRERFSKTGITMETWRKVIITFGEELKSVLFNEMNSYKSLIGVFPSEIYVWSVLMHQWESRYLTIFILLICPVKKKFTRHSSTEGWGVCCSIRKKQTNKNLVLSAWRMIFLQINFVLQAAVCPSQSALIKYKLKKALASYTVQEKLSLCVDSSTN